MKFWQGLRAPARWYDQSTENAQFLQGLGVNQGCLAISRTTTPPTIAPALAAPIQSHKQRSGITYGRFECGPRLEYVSSKGPRSAIPSGANCIQHTLSGIQHTAR